MRARMALYKSAQEYELREVVLKNKPQSMLDISPKGTVPVLHLADEVIDESIDVMRWALSQCSVNTWPIAELDHELVQHNDGPFKQALDKYKYFDRFPEQPQSAYFEQAKMYLVNLEQNLVADVDDNYFLLHDKQSGIDVAIFPFIRQLAFVDKPLFDELDFPKLKHWLSWHLDSEIFKRVMTKYSAWSPEQTEVVLFTP
jgi:glutathione S-transferase